MRWQSAAATPLFCAAKCCKSGVALRFPPQSKKVWLRLYGLAALVRRWFGKYLKCNPFSKLPNWNLARIRLIGRELKHEIGGETGRVTSHGLVQIAGGDAYIAAQVRPASRAVRESAGSCSICGGATSSDL